MKISLFDLIFRCSNLKLEQIVFSSKAKTKKTYDIAIIFGGFSMIPYRVEEAVKLYKNKKVKKLLVTGRSSYFSSPSKTEAEEMCEYLVDHGIPKEDILIEDQSRSTKENVLYSLKLLQKYYDIHSLSYVIITSDFHLKRCLVFFSHFLGSSENVFGIGARDSYTDISHWKETKYGRKIIKREALLLWYYSRKGISF